MKTRYRLTIMFGLLLCAVAGATVAGSPQADANPPAPRKGFFVEFEIKAVPPTVLPASNEKPDRGEFDFYKRNIAASVRSCFVLGNALDDHTVHDLPLINQHRDDAVRWLADQIIVEFVGGGNIMEIGMVNSDEHQASVIVQAVANAFEREVLERIRTDKLVRRDRLDKKFRAYKSNILEKQRQLFELEQADKASATAPSLRRHMAHLESLADYADRAETQAELRVARGKHQLEGMATSSPEYTAAKAEFDLAEVDHKFWADKSSALIEQISKDASQIASETEFSGPTGQLRVEIAQLQNVVNEIGNTLIRLNIELDADPRVTMVGSHT